MHQKEENLTENHSTTMILEIYAKKTINEENSSLSMNSIWEKDKNKARNLKSEKIQDYSQKPQRNCTFKNSISGRKVNL
jgi:hypothetical protein